MFPLPRAVLPSVPRDLHLNPYLFVLTHTIPLINPPTYTSGVRVQVPEVPITASRPVHVAMGTESTAHSKSKQVHSIAQMLTQFDANSTCMSLKDTTSLYPHMQQWRHVCVWQLLNPARSRCRNSQSLDTACVHCMANSTLRCALKGILT